MLAEYKYNTYLFEENGEKYAFDYTKLFLSKISDVGYDVMKARENDNSVEPLYSKHEKIKVD